jgi:hypothetical protein
MELAHAFTFVVGSCGAWHGMQVPTRDRDRIGRPRES